MLSAMMSAYNYKSPDDVLNTLTLFQILSLWFSLNDNIDYITSVMGLKLSMVMSATFSEKNGAKAMNQLLAPIHRLSDMKSNLKDITTSKDFLSDFNFEKE